MLADIPGLSSTVHICLYLPTSGKDQEFVLAFAALIAVLQSVTEEHPRTPVYLRGDANVNPKNLLRTQLLKDLQAQFSLQRLDLGHPTHHHFMGEGTSDSQLDIILHTAPPHLAETLVDVVCGQDNPLVSSHHDLIISKFPSSSTPYFPPPQALSAPRIPNDRVKVCWEDEGLENYKNLLSSALPLLQESLNGPPSEAMASILLNCTNQALNRAAELSFKTIKLSQEPRPRKEKVDVHVRRAQIVSLQASKSLKKLRASHLSSASALQAAQDAKSSASSSLRAAVRAASSFRARQRDLLLHSVLFNDPRKLQAAVKKAKASSTPPSICFKLGKTATVETQSPMDSLKHSSL